MQAIVRFLIAGAVVIALAGCAGTNFVRPDSEGLRNGETTIAQVSEKMGTPRQTGSVLKNDKNVQTVTYAYAASGGTASRPNVIPARAMGFYFLDGKLVGHEFISSWAEDHTDFDESKISNIVKGKSTRAEVNRELGKPGGYYVFPMIKDAKGEAAVYAYTETRGSAFNLSFYRKVLLVTFDPSGVVADVEFTSQGTK